MRLRKGLIEWKLSSEDEIRGDRMGVQFLD